MSSFFLIMYSNMPKIRDKDFEMIGIEFIFIPANSD